jgi:hypothetical protein
MKYDHETGRGVMDYADVRQAADEARTLLQASQDETGQQPLPATLARVETLLRRIAGATPATTRETDNARGQTVDHATEALRHVEKSDEWANRDGVINEGHRAAMVERHLRLAEIQATLSISQQVNYLMSGAR